MDTNSLALIFGVGIPTTIVVLVIYSFFSNSKGKFKFTTNSFLWITTIVSLAISFSFFSAFINHFLEWSGLCSGQIMVGCPLLLPFTLLTIIFILLSQKTLLGLVIVIGILTVSIATSVYTLFRIKNQAHTTISKAKCLKYINIAILIMYGVSLSTYLVFFLANT